ncbi:ATP-binding protein [Streptomyces niveiscabiei]|uniref:ATP-binding protein n=1 Tax=Streptomyces niveiscabiei TaxID=164115 RepID=A0ABW9I0N0_9ACTN
MTNEPGIPTGPTQHTAPPDHLNTGGTLAPPAEQYFEMRFTSTRRGARLARRFAAVRLHEWGIPYGSDDHDAIVVIVAELTSNAVRHGHVPGRDFHLRLQVARRLETARVDVTDTRGERLPPRPASVVVGRDPYVSLDGRGLVLVAGLAARWDWHLRADGPGKTVWAEYSLGSTGLM